MSCRLRNHHVRSWEQSGSSVARNLTKRFCGARVSRGRLLVKKWLVRASASSSTSSSRWCKRRMESNFAEISRRTWTVWWKRCPEITWLPLCSLRMRKIFTIWSRVRTMSTYLLSRKAVCLTFVCGVVYLSLCSYCFTLIIRHHLDARTCLAAREQLWLCKSKER